MMSRVLKQGKNANFRALKRAVLAAWFVTLSACSGTTLGNPFEKSLPPPTEVPVMLRIGEFAPLNPEVYAFQVRMCVQSIRLYDASEQILLNQGIQQVVAIGELGTVLAQAQLQPGSIHKITLGLGTTCSGFDRSIEFYNANGGPFYSADDHVLSFVGADGDYQVVPGGSSQVLNLGMGPMLLRLAAVQNSDEISQALREVNSDLSFMLLTGGGGNAPPLVSGPSVAAD